MDRLTRASIATGVAAVLLLGGAGTVAYWTDAATATGSSLTSGTLTATNGTCTAWSYASTDGGGPVTLVVPGDTVQTTCTVTVQGTGDHLAVTASLDTTSAAFSTASPNPLASALTLTEDEVQIDGVAVPSNGFSLSGGGSHTVAVTVHASFPIGDAASVSVNDSQALTASLDSIAINIAQVHS